MKDNHGDNFRHNRELSTGRSRNAELFAFGRRVQGRDLPGCAAAKALTETGKMAFSTDGGLAYYDDQVLIKRLKT